MVCVHPGPFWGRGQRQGRAMAHRVGGSKSGPGAGEGFGCPLPTQGSTPSYLLQGNVVQGRFSRAGTGATEWAGLSQGPRGGQAVHFRHAGRSPRSPCPAAPAVSPVAGGRPSACGGSPTIAPASQRRAWDDRCGERKGWWVLALVGTSPAPRWPKLSTHPPLTSSQGPGHSSAQ